MRLKLICPGKAKGAIGDLCREYIRRIERYATISVVELAEARYTKEPSPGEKARILRQEAELVLAKVDEKDDLIVLDVGGSRMTSEAFSRHLEDLAQQGRQATAFAIGGSLGVGADLKARADLRLSLSDFTLPHLLARAVLLEQIYRAYTIQRGEPYHK